MSCQHREQPRRPERGLTLVEILVALTLSFVLLAGVFQIYQSAKQTYTIQEASARLQENGRFALEVLTNDIRTAGYQGCSNIGEMKVNVIANLSGAHSGDAIYVQKNVQNQWTEALRGYEYSQVGAAPDLPTSVKTSVRANTDVLSIRRGSTATTTLTGNSSKPGITPAEIPIDNNPAAWQGGDILFVTDCDMGDIFRVTSVTATEIAVDSSTSANIRPSLGKVYGVAGRVMAYETVTYFLRLNAANVPSLYRSVFSGSDAGATPQEMVEGVRDFQVQYGLDTDSDRAPNRYVDATNVAAASWPAVVTVRVSVTLESQEQSVTSAGPLQRTFASAIGIRNGVP